MKSKKTAGISQEEHILQLQQESKEELQKIAEKTNLLYRRCVNGEDELFQEISETLDKLYGGQVRRQLQNSGCYDEGLIEETMQDARLAVWKFILQSRETHKIEEQFTSYCKGIYMHKTGDIIRKMIREGKHWKDSIDRELDSEDGEGTTVGELVKDTRETNQPDLSAEKQTDHKMFAQSFKMYVGALTKMAVQPPNGLALYYSRLLPHILHVCFNIETIPDTKAASAKWAMKIMGDRTVGALSTESEQQLKQYIDEELQWNKEFRANLETEIDTAQGRKFLKDVVYVKQYDEKKLGHMCDYMHELTSKEWLKEIKKRPDLAKDLIEYARGAERLSSVLQKGGKK